MCMCPSSLTSPGLTNTHIPATLLFIPGTGQHEGAPEHDQDLAHAGSFLRRTGVVFLAARSCCALHTANYWNELRFDVQLQDARMCVRAGPCALLLWKITVDN